MNSSMRGITIWKFKPGLWLIPVLALGVTLFLFRDGLENMVGTWGSAEYSHAYLLPFIALFLLWQKKDHLEKTAFTGSWLGVLLASVGIALFFAADLATLFVLVQYAFVIVVAGLILAFTGSRGFKYFRVPLIILLFMVPLPTFLFNNLSAQLQLISSELGVAVIRLFGISVYLEGNVIDLGVFKLQVVEACSGLRYLFPLMTLGFIAAYFFKGAFWKRAIIFLSSIPITVLMNSFRIGVIGVLVDRWGPSMAEGFLHDFEGWVIFMACTSLLILEMWLLTKVGKNRLPLREAFGLDFPAPTPKDATIVYRSLPAPFIVALILIIAVTALSFAIPKRAEIPPQRTTFASFPLQIGEWQGKGDRLEQIYIDTLKFDDYIIADFMNNKHQAVNFYVAYYASQRKGESAHSPRTCIPGGGWEITSLTQGTLNGITVAGHPLRVNRTVIQKGDVKELVYYWFQQRGRVITNEYLVKWYLFYDALTRNRTDGALVRLTAFVEPGQSLEEADARLTAFAQAVAPTLPAYIPA